MNQDIRISARSLSAKQNIRKAIGVIATLSPAIGFIHHDRSLLPNAFDNNEIVCII
ncbi:MAG: hypothetical protein JSW49_08630 [candidate division WOR-3 bacterium]|nr:MAG: hypothetical protein JSW49_08630 [candidate division WOR-3 bacterium]